MPTLQQLLTRIYGAQPSAMPNEIIEYFNITYQRQPTPQLMFSIRYTSRKEQSDRLLLRTVDRGFELSKFISDLSVINNFTNTNNYLDFLLDDYQGNFEFTRHKLKKHFKLLIIQAGKIWHLRTELIEKTKSSEDVLNHIDTFLSKEEMGGKQFMELKTKVTRDLIHDLAINFSYAAIENLRFCRNINIIIEDASRSVKNKSIFWSPINLTIAKAFNILSESELNSKHDINFRDLNNETLKLLDLEKTINNVELNEPEINLVKKYGCGFEVALQISRLNNGFFMSNFSGIDTRRNNFIEKYLSFARQMESTINSLESDINDSPNINKLLSNTTRSKFLQSIKAPCCNKDQLNIITTDIKHKVQRLLAHAEKCKKILQEMPPTQSDFFKYFKEQNPGKKYEVLNFLKDYKPNIFDTNKAPEFVETATQTEANPSPSLEEALKSIQGYITLLQDNTNNPFVTFEGSLETVCTLTSLTNSLANAMKDAQAGPQTSNNTHTFTSNLDANESSSSNAPHDNLLDEGASTLSSIPQQDMKATVLGETHTAALKCSGGDGVQE